MALTKQHLTPAELCLTWLAKGSGKFLQDTTAGPTIRPVQVIKVVTPDGIRYLPLYVTAAIAA